MNGFFIFNLVMLVICIINFVFVMANAYAPTWSKSLLFFFVLVTAFITAASWGSGPLAG